MQEINDKLSIVENHIENLVRKLMKLTEINDKLESDNIRLNAEIKELRESINNKDQSSSINEEEKQALKKEIEDCKVDIDQCISLIKEEMIDL